MPLQFTALIYPKADKVARFEELAQSVCEYVKENEPGVSQYRWYKVPTAEGEQPTIIVWETYSDEAAVETHKASPKMAWLFKTSQEEELMAAAPKILGPLEGFAGW